MAKYFNKNKKLRRIFFNSLPEPNDANEVKTLSRIRFTPLFPIYSDFVDWAPFVWQTILVFDLSVSSKLVTLHGDP